ncbi:MAG: hypothetical protein GEU83_12210 [Pseudonocardiaceae bacterium]|nr:hypothetical protein [Pseudonocardiaceae bacterium]
MDNEYLAYYEAQRKHQAEHWNTSLMISPLSGESQPYDRCPDCMTEDRFAPEDGFHAVKRHFAWAIPDDGALDVIAKYSPQGVVELGAGGGYWAGLLRARGVDVVAYDPQPPQDGPCKWQSKPGGWSEVLRGDERVVEHHADRTLFLCWPSYEQTWAADAVQLYHQRGGQTVIYVGEGAGGCTGDNTLHQLLGEDDGVCWHADEDCDCAKDVPALFTTVELVPLPQWLGVNDLLTVHQRR